MKTQPNPKVIVTKRAVVARIRRALSHKSMSLCASRSAMSKMNLGEWFIVDDRNTVKDWNLKLSDLADDLKVLAPYEVIEE
jgi:hypothetical protein